ncbi:hypothetical protein [Psychrobacter fjordensis]|uniref:hypothetical protein n=1 Tax=Psychrobacter fjordensis TaxID=664424 RepID=UPI00191B2411|nr:hypothetical protein [Psychrobacter fjordensis]
MKSASKSINESDLICLTEDTMAKIKVEGCHYLELIMSESAALDLSGNVISGNGSIEDQSRLIAIDFKPDNGFSFNRLDDNSRVFSNSKNFYVERQIGEDESIFASKVAERLDEGYMTYLRHKRMED